MLKITKNSKITIFARKIYIANLISCTGKHKSHFNLFIYKNFNFNFLTKTKIFNKKDWNISKAGKDLKSVWHTVKHTIDFQYIEVKL